MAVPGIVQPCDEAFGEQRRTYELMTRAADRASILGHRFDVAVHRSERCQSKGCGTSDNRKSRTLQKSMAENPRFPRTPGCEWLRFDYNRKVEIRHECDTFVGQRVQVDRRGQAVRTAGEINRCGF